MMNFSFLIFPIILLFLHQFMPHIIQIYPYQIPNHSFVYGKADVQFFICPMLQDMPLAPHLILIFFVHIHHSIVQVL